jgi:hypothetical protein
VLVDSGRFSCRTEEKADTSSSSSNPAFLAASTSGLIECKEFTCSASSTRCVEMVGWWVKNCSFCLYICYRSKNQSGLAATIDDGTFSREFHVVC